MKFFFSFVLLHFLASLFFIQSECALQDKATERMCTSAVKMANKLESKCKGKSQCDSLKTINQHLPAVCEAGGAQMINSVKAASKCMMGMYASCIQQVAATIKSSAEMAKSIKPTGQPKTN